jgi:hypothetical protein
MTMSKKKQLLDALRREIERLKAEFVRMRGKLQ